MTIKHYKLDALSLLVNSMANTAFRKFTYYVFGISGGRKPVWGSTLAERNCMQVANKG